MKKGDIMKHFRLCGGTFFLLVTESTYKTPTQRKRFSDSDNRINEKDILHGLFKIALPDLGKLTKDDAQNYKSCKTKTSIKLGTKGIAGKSLQERINSDYDSCYKEMLHFIDAFVNTESGRDKWLVYALLELIEKDETISSEEKFFIVKGHGAYSKAELLALEEIDIAAFLLGVFLYVLTEIQNNTVGRETYEEWCPVIGEKYDKREFNSTIGENPTRQVTFTSYDITDCSDNAPELGLSTALKESRPPIHDAIIKSANAAFPYLIAAINSLGKTKDTEDSLKTFLSQAYYQLIITNHEIYGARSVIVPLDRGLSYRGTPPEIIERCASLSDEGIEELKQYPAIICNENCFSEGNTVEHQLSIIAQIKGIKVGEDAVVIRYQPLASFFQTQLNEYSVDFGLSSCRTLTTLNTSHWTVRKKNLYQELCDAEIEFCRYVLLYRSSTLKAFIPPDQTELQISDFDNINRGKFQTINPFISIQHLENDQVYQYTAVYQFKSVYIDGKRFVRMSASWNNIYISGDLSTENWVSQSYMNNYANAGSGKVTAIFKVLNYETNAVQFLVIMEVK